MMNSEASYMKDLYAEVVHELTPPPRSLIEYGTLAWNIVRDGTHVPFFPFLHRPGWLLRYILGPFDGDYFESLVFDITAGITVSLLLIPQALSYATLANLPPVNGLYSAIIPSLCYTLFGTGLQLAVGPVAVVSLLVGTIVTKYAPEYATDPEAAVDTAAQASICVGIILIGLGLLNLGHFIHFISHPVMSGFTSGAAMSIGLSQLKSAFGFLPKETPQTGQDGYEFNYLVMTWFRENFNGVFKLDPTEAKYAEYNGKKYINHYAIKICFGLFIPLIFIQILKVNIVATPARKKSWLFRLWTLFTSFTPLIAIAIGASMSRKIHESDDTDFYARNLKTVGFVTPGLNFARVPKIRHPFGAFFVDCIPLALVLFMESYAIARRLATRANQLHLLNASQELFAVGLGNILGAVTSSYPVSGSFSRSSLNATSGARTPLSKLVTLAVVLLALSFLTEKFQYIPNCALAAVIFVSIKSLICFEDIWETFRHSRADCIVLLLTLSLTFVFDTSLGLAVGIGSSVVFYLADLAFAKATSPQIKESSRRFGIIDADITYVNVNGDLTWLQASRVKEFVVSLYLSVPASKFKGPNCNATAFDAITGRLDAALRPRLIERLKGREVPKAVVLDLLHTRVVDTTGLVTIMESVAELRDRKILCVLMRASPTVEKALVKFGFKNDVSSGGINLDRFLAESGEIPTRAPAVVQPAVGVVKKNETSLVKMEEGLDQRL